MQTAMTTGDTMKIAATCCETDIRYPTDTTLLEDGNRLIDRLLDKFCARHKIRKSRTHRIQAPPGSFQDVRTAEDDVRAESMRLRRLHHQHLPAT